MLLHRAFAAQHSAVSRLILVPPMVQTRRAVHRASAMTSENHKTAAVAHLEFEGINNIRDLSEEFSSLKPGCIFRTAAPINATPSDIKMLYNDLGIKDLIDLRSSEEMHLQPVRHAFDGISFCRYKRDSALNRVVPDATSYRHGSRNGDIMRVQIAVMEKHRYTWSILSRMKKRHIAKLAATALYDKEGSRRLAIEEVNKGGLEGLYRILLEDSSEYFVAALRHIRRSVEGDRPVLFFCKAGKDRTGLLAMLLLSVLGASEEQILRDYERSDAFHMVALAGLEQDPQATGLDREKFERAPREAMHAALQFLQEQYGGVQQYLVQAGFGLDEQYDLRDALLMRAESPAGSVDSPLL